MTPDPIIEGPANLSKLTVGPIKDESDKLPNMREAAKQARKGFTIDGVKVNALPEEGMADLASSIKHWGFESEYIMFDIETSGLDGKQDHIVQIVAHRYKDGVKLADDTKHFQTYLNDGNGNVFGYNDPLKVGDKSSIIYPFRLQELTKADLAVLDKVDPQRLRHTPSTHITPEILTLLGKDTNKVMVDFVDYLKRAQAEGVQIVGFNTKGFDVQFIKDFYQRVTGEIFDAIPGHHIDMGIIVKAAHLGLTREANETMEKFEERVRKTAPGQKWGVEFTAEGLEIDTAGAHNAINDVRIQAEIYEEVRQHIEKAHETPEQIEAALKKGHQVDKLAVINHINGMDKATARIYKGLGFVGGAVVAAGVYMTFGRSKAEEAFEHYGGPQNNPFLDAVIAAGGLVLSNEYLKRNHKDINSLVKLAKATVYQDQRTDLKSQPFKYFSLAKKTSYGAIAYSAIAIGHNMVANDPGESWRYPLLVGTAGVAGVYAYTMLQAYDNDIGQLTLDAHANYKEKVQNFKDAKWGKAINEGWAKAKEGKYFKDTGSAANWGNALMKAFVESTPAKVAVGLGLLGGIISYATSGNVGRAAEVAIEQGEFNETRLAELGTSAHALSHDITSYRQSHRYSQNYRGDSGTYHTPHGLAGV